MKKRRLAILFLLLLGVSALLPQLARADVSCHDVENCTFCYFYNNGVYAGSLKWCKPAQ